MIFDKGQPLPKGWLTADYTGRDRLGQYVETLLLRIKVRLFYRRWRRFTRRFRRA